MKKIYLLLILAVLTNEVTSQIPEAITIEPAWASAYDELTLTFDPDLACHENGPLSGVASVAIHSGVVLQSGEDWEYVVIFNETGANGQSAMLTPTGDGRYSITYTPSDFYGFPEHTKVTHICAVFNNGYNWNQDGRDFDENRDCTDFLIPLQPAMPAAISLEPQDGTAYDELTLTFDPDEACSEFATLTGSPSVAIHSGVALQSGETWQFVVQFDESGVNGQSTTLAPTGDGKYAITFTPNDFYGFPNGEMVTGICAVFNNGEDWTQDGKDYTSAGNCTDFFIPLRIQEFTVDLKVFLEGPFREYEMSADLCARGFLPLSQPYNIAPWNYGGTEVVEAIPNNNIVDWILVQFREASEAYCARPGTTVKQQAAFLLKDGTVVDLDGISSLTYEEPLTKDLFVVIKHRNHLAVLSANPINSSKGFYNYDFTTAADKAYDSGQKNLGNVFGMFGGDGFCDAEIDIVDLLFEWDYDAGKCGYIPGDYNLNGEVQNSDKNDIWYGNIGESSFELNASLFLDPPTNFGCYRKVPKYYLGSQVGLTAYFQWNSSPNCIGYNVYSSTVSGIYLSDPDITTTSTNGNHYYSFDYGNPYILYLVVRAYDEFGESCNSNEIAILIAPLYD